MSEQEVWPPPPTTPDPTVFHDEFLTACLRAPATKQSLSRMRLCRDLHAETGLSPRQCRIFVNSYCDRNTLLMPGRISLAWFGCFPPLIQMATIVAVLVIQSSLRRNWHAATTSAARHAINVQQLHVNSIFLGVIVVCTFVTLIVVVLCTRQARRDSAGAREKMSASRA